MDRFHTTEFTEQMAARLLTYLHAQIKQGLWDVDLAPFFKSYYRNPQMEDPHVQRNIYNILLENKLITEHHYYQRIGLTHEGFQAAKIGLESWLKAKKSKSDSSDDLSKRLVNESHRTNIIRNKNHVLAMWAAIGVSIIAVVISSISLYLLWQK